MMPHLVNIISIHQSRRNQTMDDDNEDDNNNSMWWEDLPRTQFARYLWPYPFHRPNNASYHPVISGILSIEIEVMTPHDEQLMVQDIYFIMTH